MNSDMVQAIAQEVIDCEYISIIYTYYFTFDRNLHISTHPLYVNCKLVPYVASCNRRYFR